MFSSFRLNTISAVPLATYSVSAAAGATSVNEGSSLTFNVTTTNVADSTILYWTSSNTTDFTTTSGSFTITSNAGSFSVTPTADATTEGAETFTVSVRTDSTSGTIVATSATITINDTSLTPTYSLSTAGGATSMNEGVGLAFTTTTTNVADNTTLYWTINHITTAAADFSAESGAFTVLTNSGVFAVNTVADLTTEGAQTFTVSVRTGSTAGPVVATSSTITVNDTSTSAPAATVSPAANNVNEGSSLTINVTTTNFASGTLYWTLNHSTTADADFSAVSGSFTITASAGSFSIGAVADSTTEGAQTFTVSVRTTSTAGTVIGTSSTITINDTSTAPAKDLTDGYGQAANLILAVPFRTSTGFGDIAWRYIGNPYSAAQTLSGPDSSASIQTTTSKFYGSAYYSATGGTKMTYTLPVALNTSTGAFTIEFWVRPTATAHFKWLVCNGYVTPEFGLSIIAGTTTPPATLAWNGGGGANGILSTASGAWTHISITRARYFVNGVYKGTNTWGSAYNWTAFQFGHQDPADGNDFQGYLQDLRIYKVDLHPSTATFTVPTQMMPT